MGDSPEIIGGVRWQQVRLRLGFGAAGRRRGNNHGSDVVDKISFTGDNGDNRDFEV
jgi:hypothetical protein